MTEPQVPFSTCPECNKGILNILKSTPPQVQCIFCKTKFTQRAVRHQFRKAGW